MTDADAQQAAPPRLVLICVPGLSHANLPELPDSSDRSGRPLAVDMPRTDSALIADVATGVEPSRHGIGADSVWDPVLEAFRPPDSTDLKATPLWEIGPRYGRSACVIGTSLAHASNGDLPASDSGLCRIECGDGQPSARQEQAFGELNESALREILGESLVERLLGPPGRERRAACASVDALRSVLRVHTAATARLQTQTDDLVAVAYTGFGSLLRSGIVDQDRTAAFVAMLCGRVHELAGPEASVLIAGGPTLPDGVIAEQAGATSGGSGVLLLLGPRGQPLARDVSARDVLPTALDLMGLPQAMDLPGSSATRGETQRLEPVFTHEAGERPQPRAHHPEQSSIDGIIDAGSARNGVSPGRSLLLRDEACRAAFEIAKGRIPAWRVGSDNAASDLPPPLLVCAAASAAQRRDAEVLQQIISAMEDRGFDRVFIEAALAALADARGDSDGAAAAIDDAESLLEGRELLGEFAPAAVAMACEQVGLWERGARLWERHAQAARSKTVAAHAWLGVARCSLRGRELGRAVDAAKSVLELAPNDADASVVLGIALLWLRDAAGAEAALQTALRRRPESQPVRTLLVRVLRRLGRHDEASELERNGPRPRQLDDVNQW
ncbi:MAG: tetratricopeptide repeat protein [Planctomycetota bacterium]